MLVGSITGAAEAAKTTKREENAIVWLAPVEGLKGSGEGGRIRRIGGVGGNGKHIEPNCGFTDSPIPEALRKPGFSEEGSSHCLQNLPSAFNQAIL